MLLLFLLLYRFVINSFIIAESCSSAHHRIKKKKKKKKKHFSNTRERTPQKYFNFMLQKVIFCFTYNSNIACRKNLGFISSFVLSATRVHKGREQHNVTFSIYWTENVPTSLVDIAFSKQIANRPK